MNLLPVGLNVEGRPALVVGGGAVALRKSRMLGRCGAKVLVVSPEVRPEVRKMAAAGRIVWRRRRFSPATTARPGGPALVFACTDDPVINKRIERWAAARGLWVNRADTPKSALHVPAVAQLGGGLQVAIFSGGQSPGYVKYLRKRLERAIGSSVPEELRMLAHLRTLLKKTVDSPARRKRILTRLIETGALARLARRSPRDRKAALKKLAGGQT